jgi:hypothetical protein
MRREQSMAGAVALLAVEAGIFAVAIWTWGIGA